MSERSESLAALEPLGFTEIEALVYVALLRTPDQTGYALSKLVNKGQPSIYAALSGLEQKGAIVKVAGRKGGFTAVPPDELVGRLKSRFERQCEAAAKELRKIETADVDELVLHMKRSDVVYEKARALIDDAKETLVFELFPAAVERLRPALEAAARRSGLKMAGMVLRPQDHIEGAQTVVSPIAAKILDVWPSTLLILLADAEVSLVAVVDDDGAQAIWTDTKILSVILHNAITSDIILHRDAEPDWIGPNRQLLGELPIGLRRFFGSD